MRIKFLIIMVALPFGGREAEDIKHCRVITIIRRIILTNIITIDVGTMSLRASIYTESGENLTHASYEYSAIYLPQGHVEQETKDWEIALEVTLSELKKIYRGK